MTWTSGRGPILQRRAVLAAGGALAVAGCDQVERPLFSADTHSKGYPTVKAVEAMGKLLEDRTNGELSIRVYAGGQLGSEPDTLEITIFGGLDMNRVNLAPLTPIAPVTAILSLPFIFGSVGHARRTFDGAPGRAILDAIEPMGLIGLCYYDSGARSFYNRRGPLETPADMRGLKLRVPTSDVFVSMVGAAGANATPMPLGEVYQALLQGVVDGAENNWPSYESMRHHEVAPYYSLTEHVMAPEVLVMSARTWRKLTPELRDIVMGAARESVGIMRGFWDEREIAARERLTAQGVKVNAVDRAAFAKAMEPVWDRFVRTPEMRRLVEDVRNLGTADA